MSVIGTRSYDKLLAGNQQVRADGCTIKSGANLSRGAVLGKISVGAVPATGTAKDGGNTGTGTMTSVAGKRRTQVGVYSITCIAASTGKGQFAVVNPKGVLKGIAIVGAPYADDEIGFSLSDGDPDFAVGDGFTVTVPASADANKYKLVDKSSIDGSGVAKTVLLEDVAALSSDVVTEMALSGQFNAAALSFGGTDTFADHAEDLKAVNINLKTNNIPE